MTFRTRFAPSPTGPLHLGHAYSAILAHDMARANDGAFLLRIEDIDQSRSRASWETQIYDDLSWLGLMWDEAVVRQSERLSDYNSALEALWQRNLLFPCACSRRDIAEALSAPQESSTTMGPDGPIYPGTCRLRAPDNANAPIPKHVALRLFLSRAVDVLGDDPPLSFQECLHNGKRIVEIPAQALETTVGDVVLARKDMGTSYHLSVVLDDAAQGITDVVRGEDLHDTTKIHVLLQRLIGLPTPRYHHHMLIRDDQGRRLAKRDDARAISKYRDDGASPADIRRLVGLDA
ncbi:MAG: tRNA glutamyl-Q(34) synthetase GluQRS [Boseongicola sp.]|nr:tRNA glutamyl-Q(34) synthetase GluQRS [Boseongicola sp.]NNJ69491.1 tRNA glutamyl-Q(34) synthetase GluQRS [Boseongicola sp.]